MTEPPPKSNDVHKKEGKDMGDAWMRGEETLPSEHANLEGDDQNVKEEAWCNSSWCSHDDKELFDDGKKASVVHWIVSDPDDPEDGWPLFHPRAEFWITVNRIVIVCVIYSAIITPVEVAWRLEGAEFEVITCALR